MAHKPEKVPQVASPYKVGHVVHLRTGGPDMVIEGIEPGGDLNCIWFSIRGDRWEPPFRDCFKPFTVQLAAHCDPEDPEAEPLPTEADEPATPTIPGGIAELILARRRELSPTPPRAAHSSEQRPPPRRA